MKKIAAIICVLFALVMVLALPVSAATPYQTYTYSIGGTALYSPDAYVPSKNIDATYMGLDDADFLCKYHSDLATARDKLAETEAVLAEAAELYATTDKNYTQAQSAYNTANKTYTDLYKSYSKISSPSDIEVDDEGNVYIADTGNSRIIVLDRYYNVKFIIASFLNRQGIMDGLNKPKGVYITSDKPLEDKEGKIYVCDTEAYRIVTFDREGNFIDIIPKPESELFDSSSVYKPVAVAVDNYDRLYVVSSTTYQGIIVMTEAGEFTGFVGAQKVTISAWDRIWRNFQTEEQRELSQSYVSTEFNNITLTGDFIYVTTSSISEANVISSLTSTSGDYAPVKMLNASGDEIMRRNGFFSPSGEVDHAKVKTSDTIYGASTVVDVAVGPEKTWSIIDQKRSKVFTYDFDGNLLFAFGDMGRQLGNISQKGLAGIVYQGDNMLLLNATDATFTVYNRTEYGDVLIQALQNQNNRQNDQAIKDWKEILKRNSNFDAAYIGIGNALSNQNKYEESLTYYKAAYDTANYSTSYAELRKTWISKYILLIPVFVIALVFAISKFLGYSKKLNKRVSTSREKRTFWQEIMFAFHVIFHPFDGFWDMKHEKRGSLRAAITILAVTIAGFYYQNIGQGYIMNPTGAYSTIFSTITSVLVPLFLWVVANWCLTTLFDGEGSFKDIFIATCYALTPMPIIMIPATIASNFILASETGILSLIITIAFIWAGILIFFGTMVTHDYSMGKNVITTLGTIVGMVIIMFIAILFSTLLGKLVSFATNIVTELQYRM
ncbi:MAG: YIP1 family protein [Clostridia bacterium]|nr:YIP1 family protein [Clostridia bacterium]